MKCSFTCRKCTTWDPQFYLPSKGNSATDYHPEIPLARFEPANLGSNGKHVTTGPCRQSTVAAQVQARVKSYGICDEQSGDGAGYLQVLWFPLPVFIPPTAPQSPPSIIWGW
jgi:hypothetical protein